VSKRREIAAGVVGAVSGFIVGFFVAQGLNGPGSSPSPVQAEESGLPENHPTPEQMARVQELIEHVRQTPADRSARVELGNLFYDMGRFDAAIPWYEEALGLDADDARVTTDLGTCYLYSGDVTKAVELYKKSLEIEPSHAQTLQNLGIVYFSQGDYDRAIEAWEQLLEAHPDYPQIDQIRRQIETARLHADKAGMASRTDQ